MCGFVGSVSFNSSGACDPARLQSAVNLMRHRGPDEAKWTNEENWALGFCRLAILDLSENASQPMHTNDRTGWLVFNGEIYNYVELREELRAKGEQFRSTGDAEVLLYWLRRHGSGGISRLNGMFAFAFLDLRRRKLLLARDRVGVKPLLYFYDRNKIVFGSEIKAVIEAAGLQPEIDVLAVNQYFCFNYVPAPRTVFRGISKLEPGRFLEIELGNHNAPRPQTYWKLHFEPVYGRTDDKWVEDIEVTLSDAVKNRLVSDVPVGVFLSGGLDSSVVMSMALASHARKDIVAFTVGFDEKEWDESDVARSVARHSAIEHRVTRLKSDAWEILPELVWHYEEPFADSSAVPTYYLCKAAAEHATVFLSGDGGDEALAGYIRYQTARNTAWLDKIPQPLRAALFGGLALMAPTRSRTHLRALKAGLPTWKRYATQSVFPEDPLNLFPLAQELRKSEHEISGFLYDIAREAVDLHPLSRLQYLDYQLYLANDILVKIDRASMAHSIEIRSPFMDYRLIELAARIPVKQQYDGRQGKRLLRRLAAKYLPKRVLEHRKQGFGVPLPLWFRRQTLDRIEEIFNSRAARERGFYDLNAIKSLIAWQRRGIGRDLSHILWRLLFFEEWCRQFLDGHADLNRPALSAVNAR